MAAAGDSRVPGPWLVEIRVGEPPKVLRRDVINPLSANALVTVEAGGTLIASGSPIHPIPNQAIGGDHLYVPAGHGTWVPDGERGARFRLAALLCLERGASVATLFIDGSVEIDAEHDTFTGPYAVDVHLSRGWTRGLPALDGSVQGWRVEAPEAVG
jgi:hypothetical protein